jgi:hypothetical protein
MTGRTPEWSAEDGRRGLQCAGSRGTSIKNGSSNYCRCETCHGNNTNTTIINHHQHQHHYHQPPPTPTLPSTSTTARGCFAAAKTTSSHVEHQQPQHHHHLSSNFICNKNNINIIHNKPSSWSAATSTTRPWPLSSANSDAVDQQQQEHQHSMTY